MQKTVSAWDARRNFGKLLRDLNEDGRPIIVESHGKAVAAMVPIAQYNHWQWERNRLFDLLRQSSEYANLDDDEAMRIANEVIEEVRRESRE